MCRSSLAFAALLFSLALPLPEAQAGDISILAGVGPRFDAADGDVNAVSVLHVSYEVVPMLLISGELQGYTGGLGVPDDFALADVQLGLLFSAPIPGWFGIEVGASIGVHNLLEERHKEDSVVGMLKPEIALTARAALFKARLSYQHNLLPTGASAADFDDGQFTIMAGVVF